jgi:hypothetical protein
LSHCQPDGGADGRADSDESDELQTVEQRFAWHLEEGSIERSGGCTDAAMRMTNLLKVRISLSI